MLPPLNPVVNCPIWGVFQVFSVLGLTGDFRERTLVMAAAPLQRPMKETLDPRISHNELILAGSTSSGQFWPPGEKRPAVLWAGYTLRQPFSGQATQLRQASPRITATSRQKSPTEFTGLAY